MDPTQLESWKRALTGLDVGGATLKHFLANGNFGLVFEGDLGRRPVAVKCLVPNADLSTQLEFENEGRLLAHLAKASNVVHIFHSGTETLDLATTAGVPISVPVKYHVMELASGCLDELCLVGADTDQWCWSDRLVLWRGVLRGIHQMHLKNVVHRDIKSSNCLVFLGARGMQDCKVSDLGRSKDLNEPRTLPEEAYRYGMGDLRFAAPEHIWAQGRATADSHRAADLFGLGSALFELAHGIGITSYSLGLSRAAIHDARLQRAKGQTYDASGLRASYQTAFATFHQQLPAPIADRATRLLSELCEPDPTRRLALLSKRDRSGHLQPTASLFREADILIKTQRIHERTSKKRGI